MINYKIYPKNKKLQKPCIIGLGKFDGVHNGHEELAREVRKISFADALTSTFVTFDPNPRQYFDTSGSFLPLQTLDQRVKKILAIGIEQVIVIEFNKYIAELEGFDFFDWLVIELGVKNIVVGDEFKFGKERSGNIDLLRELCESRSVQLTVIPKVLRGGVPISSTSIREERASGF
jgi:riboflavin kinase / FMN adenylyltransferase